MFNSTIIIRFNSNAAANAKIIIFLPKKTLAKIIIINYYYLYSKEKLLLSPTKNYSASYNSI
jgi:hypothetical protein